MKSDIYVQDPQKRPICPKVPKPSYVQPVPSKFHKKAQIDKLPEPNNNFKTMPKDSPKPI